MDYITMLAEGGDKVPIVNAALNWIGATVQGFGHWIWNDTIIAGINCLAQNIK